MREEIGEVLLTSDVSYHMSQISRPALSNTAEITKFLQLPRFAAPGAQVACAGTLPVLVYLAVRRH